jgi:hypothetical protein
VNTDAVAVNRMENRIEHHPDSHPEACRYAGSPPPDNGDSAASRFVG